MMTLSIEVCYALPEGNSAICALSLGEGVTVREAIEASGLLARFPEIDLNVQKVGVFGKIRPLEPFYFVPRGGLGSGLGTCFGRGAWELAARADGDC